MVEENKGDYISKVALLEENAKCKEVKTKKINEDPHQLDSSHVNHDLKNYCQSSYIMMQ